MSTLPTVWGEKVVMRIVDKTKKTPTLDEMGIEGNNLVLIERAIAMPDGIVLTSGPTGSGKTTTLYACLQTVNNDEVNIMTIEDPVEIRIDGLNQSQVFPDIGYTFASGLRTALRQDPDIIMVGEIRDHETMNIAIEASLTGHLVFSTIHTNSAAETITRIINMGIKSFLIPSSLNIIIAQRLVRKLCTYCATPIPESELDTPTRTRIQRAMSQTPASEIRERLSTSQIQTPIVYEPVGCEKCDGK
jgi:type IV pilus assembly protein PilB